MPNAYIQKVAKDKGIAIETLERLWNEAKTIANKDDKLNKDKDPDRYYGTVTIIFKNKLKSLTENSLPLTFNEFIDQQSGVRNRND